jgi:hypothetical protein
MGRARWAHEHVPCPSRQPAKRETEIAYRWVPPAACTARVPGAGPYLRNAALSLAWLDRLGCVRLLIVGDSLQDAMAATLREYVRSDVPHRSVNVPPMDMVRNDYSAINEQEERGIQLTLKPWAPYVRNGTLKPNVVVVNRGPHWSPDSNFTRGYENTLLFLRLYAPHVRVIARTSPAGHANCKRYAYQPPLSAPLPLPPADLPWAKYGWDQVMAQNALLRALVSREPAVAAQTTVLDVVPATALRADSHVTHRDDCLHYCMPGPVDMWVELLGNVLLLQQQLGLLPMCEGPIRRPPSPDPTPTPMPT